MNFYKHHIGDFAAATAHLTFIEDAAFSRLLRIYYRDEKPLPVELKAVQRLAGARSDDEREAVETVLREFFRLADDGWHNKRCDEEIERANAQAEANRATAIAREQRRRATNQSRNEHESCNESSEVREPSQTPDSRLQTSLRIDPHTPPVLVGVFEGHENPQPAEIPQSTKAAIALRKVGVTVTGANPDLIAATAEGVTVDHLLETAASYPGKPARYIISAARREHADRAAPITPTTSPAGTGKQMQGLRALEAMKSANRMANGRDFDGAAEALPALVGPDSGR